MFNYNPHSAQPHTSIFYAPSAHARVVVAMHEEREIRRLSHDLSVRDQHFGAWLRARS